MSVLTGIRARVRALLRRRASDAELSEEIRFHIELETEKNVRLGLTPAEARRLATAHFGGIERVREEHRDVRRVQWIEDLGADVRFALRALRRTPIFAATAIVTIALGIGANVAIFSAVNAVVLQPLPFPHPEQLLMVTEENPERHWHHQMASTANYLDWRDDVPGFSDIAAYDYSATPITLTGSGDARVLRELEVTGNFFSTLGVRAALGRTLLDAETWKDAPLTVVLSYAAWQREFGGDPSVVGRTIMLDAESHQIVGVMPRDFAFPWDNIDLWTAPHWDREKIRNNPAYRSTHWMPVIARLKPGVGIATAGAQLQAVATRLQHEYPKTNTSMSTSLTPLHDFIIGDTRRPLAILLASVAILLLIACANVGNLLLVRAAGRRREAALRLALGAGRARLARQAITESLVLSSIGGGAGLALGWIGTRVLVALQPDKLLPVRAFGIDATVAAYVAGTTVGAGLLFGIAPALWTRGRDPAEALKDGSRGGTWGRGIKAWGDTLVVAEVALAVIMTMSAGLLVRSFLQLANVNPGFDPRGVVAFNINTYGRVTDPTAFFDQVVARARTIPGVTDVARAGIAPLNGANAWTSDFTGRGRAAGVTGTELPHFYVSPEYFSTLRVPLRRGRLFTADDRKGAPAVVLINETFARNYFAGQDPLGQSLCFEKAVTPSCKWSTIIGVVADEHDTALDKAPRSAVFESTLQSPLSGVGILLRTNGDPAALAAPMRAIVREIAPQIAISSVRTLEELRERSLARTRFFATLLGLFAAVGLVLAIVGVYGVVAHLARSRTREMGIRIALGAQAAQVRSLLVTHGLRLTTVGLVAGGVVALVATRAMRALLFDVAPHDPVTLAAVVVLLAGASVAASWIPASRASRADPVRALRAD